MCVRAAVSAYRCVYAVALGCVLPSLLTGCHRSTPSLPIASPASVRVSARPDTTSVHMLQAAPEYRRIVQLFDQKQYALANTALNQMLSEPTRTAEEQAFLRRQQAFCTDALTGRSSSASSSTVPASAPRRPERSVDCGPRALAILLQRLDKQAGVEELKKAAGTTSYGTTLEGLQKAAKAQGLKAEGVQMDGPALDKLSTLAIARVDGDHYVAVLKVVDGQATLQDPNHSKEEVITTDTLLRRSGGILLTVKP